jgi:hypothetical protein
MDRRRSCDPSRACTERRGIPRTLAAASARARGKRSVGHRTRLQERLPP